eukprot:144864-Chlamydomonas_euryale.AAC.2
MHAVVVIVVHRPRRAPEAARSICLHCAAAAAATVAPELLHTQRPWLRYACESYNAAALAATAARGGARGGGTGG